MIEKENSEIITTLPPIWAEGSCSNKPTKEQIQEYVESRGYSITNEPNISFDDLQKCWRWNVDIKYKPTTLHPSTLNTMNCLYDEATKFDYLNFKKNVKIGDLVINHWASEDNPHRIGVFIGFKKKYSGYNKGEYAMFYKEGNIDDRWKIPLDSESKFEIVK